MLPACPSAQDGSVGGIISCRTPRGLLAVSNRTPVRHACEERRPEIDRKSKRVLNFDASCQGSVALMDRAEREEFLRLRGKSRLFAFDYFSERFKRIDNTPRHVCKGIAMIVENSSKQTVSRWAVEVSKHLLDRQPAIDKEDHGNCFVTN